MQLDRLRKIIDAIAAVRVAVIGDFCLDAYWTLDSLRSERSIETGRPVQHVASQRYSLGGAGNVAANLAALGVRTILPLGVTGDDPFGREMLRLLGQTGAAAPSGPGMIVQQANWDTPVYCKPHIGDEEQDRIDFGAGNALSDASADALLAGIRAADDSLDAIIVNQQLRPGLWTDPMIAGFNSLRAGRPGPLCVVDSRDCIERFDGLIWKLNRAEAARICGMVAAQERTVSRDETIGHARQIHRRTGRLVFVTLGEEGNLIADDRGVRHLPGVRVAGPVDPVGAGDASLAAFAAALAAGAGPDGAAEIANLAAAVTVRKLKQTGTASPAEIIALANRQISNP